MITFKYLEVHKGVNLDMGNYCALSPVACVHNCGRKRFFSKFFLKFGTNLECLYQKTVLKACQKSNFSRSRERTRPVFCRRVGMSFLTGYCMN